MLNRKYLKERAKTVLANSYWISFLVALIMTIASGGMPVFSANFSGGAEEMNLNIPPDISAAFWIALLVVFAIALVSAAALAIFVYAPLIIGGKRFFTRTGEGCEVKFTHLGYYFKNGYWNVVKTVFMKNLYVFLWSLIGLIPIIIIMSVVIAAILLQSAYMGSGMASIGWIGLNARKLFGYTLDAQTALAMLLLFVLMIASLIGMIPVIVAQYRYLMVEYLLVDNPNMHWKDALRQSSEMMHGNKWAAFKLNLSFLGWTLLGSCICGIGVLFVNPYIEATYAQLYIYLKNQQFAGQQTEYIPYQKPETEI